MIKMSFLKGKSNDIFSDFKLFDMNPVFIIQRGHIATVFITVCGPVSAFGPSFSFTLFPLTHTPGSDFLSFPPSIRKAVSRGPNTLSQCFRSSRYSKGTRPPGLREPVVSSLTGLSRWKVQTAEREMTGNRYSCAPISITCSPLTVSFRPPRTLCVQPCLSCLGPVTRSFLGLNWVSSPPPLPSVPGQHLRSLRLSSTTAWLSQGRFADPSPSHPVWLCYFSPVLLCHKSNAPCFMRSFRILNWYFICGRLLWFGFSDLKIGCSIP